MGWEGGGGLNHCQERQLLVLSRTTTLCQNVNKDVVHTWVFCGDCYDTVCYWSLPVLARIVPTELPTR